MNNRVYKVLHITSPGFRTAGKMVFDIHHKFLEKGHISFVVTNAEHEKSDNVYSYYSKTLYNIVKIRNKFIRLYRRFFPQKFRSYPGFAFLDLKEDRSQIRYKNILSKVPFKPDAIILYALQEFVNSKTIYDISSQTGAMIFWLPYDAAPFTGGCHYSWDCIGYINKCGKCPQLLSVQENDLSRKNWNYKEKYLREIDIHILACSHWLMEKASESSLFCNYRITKWMIPMDDSFSKYLGTRSEIRISLGLDPKEKYVMFGAVKTTDIRKGIKYLIEALNIISREKLTENKFKVIVLGRQEDFDSSCIPFETIRPGFINDRETLIRFYKAADVVVVPSVEDCGPLMISEAITSGTPVAAFEMGSAHDLVFSGVTGYKAKLMDSPDLAKGIASILNLSETEYKKMKENCRNISDEKVNIGKQVDKLIEIFRNNS
jgi:glycosyltransferase involved in cell wall biosynthesis